MINPEAETPAPPGIEWRPGPAETPAPPRIEWRRPPCRRFVRRRQVTQGEAHSTTTAACPRGTTVKVAVAARAPSVDVPVSVNAPAGAPAAATA